MHCVTAVNKSSLIYVFDQTG